jgi:hypothetical protein
MMCALAFYFAYRSSASFNLNLNLNQKELKLLKEFMVYPALPNMFNATWVKG